MVYGWIGYLCGEKMRVDKLLLMKLRPILSLVICALLVSIALADSTEPAQDSSSDPVMLFDVSASPGSSYYDLYGSLQGGTTLYINGLGFDKNSKNNQVKFGDYPCIVPDGGATETLLTCLTTKPWEQSKTDCKYLTVSVKGKQSATCNSWMCCFSYSTWSTPEISRISPRTSFPGQLVQFFGTHMVTNITNTTNIKFIKIGDNPCSLFNLTQDDYVSYSISPINCRVDPLMTAGYYNVSELNSKGYARKNGAILSSSISKGFNYQHKVIPVIYSVSDHLASSQGHIVTLNGSGFGTAITEIQVTAGSLPCQTTNISPNEVTCIVRQDATQNSSTVNLGRLATNTTSTQKLGFISGSGFIQKRYNLTQTNLPSFISDVRGNSAQLISTETIGDLQVVNMTNTSGYFMRGYFKAPVSGNYMFRINTNDRAALFLSTVKGSAELDYNAPLIFINNTCKTATADNFFMSCNSAARKSGIIAMTAGDAYYMELFFMSSIANSSFLKVGTQVPNTNPIFESVIPEVQNFTVAPVNDPEVYAFAITGATGGFALLKRMEINWAYLYPQSYGCNQSNYTNSSGNNNYTNNTASNNYTNPNCSQGKMINTANITIAWNTTALELENVLKNLSDFAKYDPRVYLQNYDASGQLTTIAAQTARRVWRIQINKYRYRDNATYEVDSTNLTNEDPFVTPTVDFVQLQQHSPQLQGYYKLSLNGILLSWGNSSYTSNDSSNIYATNYPSTIKEYIKNSWRCKLVNVDSDNPFMPEAGYSMVITLRGCPGVSANMPLMVADASNLTGGRDGTTPSIDITRIQAGSLDLMVQPLNSQYLFTAADKPQVTAYVRGVPSACFGDCSFEFTSNIPTISTATFDYNTARIIFSMSYPNSTGVSLSNITVTLNDIPCTGLVGSINNFNCTLPKNYDGKPNLRAGEYKPVVYVGRLGEAKPSSAITNFVVNLTLTGPAVPDIVGKAGGFPIIVKGNGLPFHYDTTLSATLCNKSALINWVNNTHLNITTPACTLASTSLIVNYNSRTASISFSYDQTVGEPIISDLSVFSASPVLKGSLKIFGSNFGNNKSALAVYLTNSTGFRVYQLNVLEANDTEVKVKLSGGLTGAFNVSVVRWGYGSSIEATPGIATFKYEIVITGISPTVGSKHGGTILTITGRNFSPDPLDNQVYISDEMNWFCLIISSTATEIKCRTPPMHPDWTNLTQHVTVVGRIIEDSSCSGTCLFTYDNTTSPDILPPLTTSFSSSVPLTMTGQRLVNAGVLPVVTVGQTTAAVTAATDDSVSFAFPAMYQGTYYLNIYVDGIGYTNPTEVTVSSSLFGPSPSSGSTVGNIIQLQGTGLLDPASDSFLFSIETNTGEQAPFTIISSTPSILTFKLMSEEPMNYMIKYGNSQFNYQTTVAATPSVTLTGPMTRTYDPAGLTLTLMRANTSLTVSDISAYPIDSNGDRFGPSIPLVLDSSNADGSLTVNASALTAGRYKFEIMFPGYGYATADPVEITNTVTTPADVVTGYAGGSLLTVTGTGLSSFSQLLVEGVPASLVSAATTQLVYSVPEFSDKMEINRYSQTKIKKLKGTPFADNTPNRRRVFDNKFSTKYTSSSPQCFVGLDLGAKYKGNLFRIRFFIDNRAIAPASFVGASFTASTDGVSYTPIFTIANNVTRGWNQWRTESPLPTIYRYLRFEHNATSACQLSEVEFYDAKFKDNSNNVTFKVEAVFTDGVHTQTWANKVEYRKDKTPNVTALNPPFSSPVGNSPLIITGTGFGTDVSKVSVKVDGIVCAVTAVTSTSITCTVGPKTSIIPDPTFDVFIDGRRSIVSCRNFTYAFRYSDPNTWSGDFPPIEGDAVYVPKGMVLMMDQSTPKLKTIIVEGSIVFSDENDLVVQSESIIINQGAFEAGTEEFPYQKKITIALYGGYYNRQLPIYGNKVLGCHNCRFDMHGSNRISWTELQDPISPSSTTLKLTKPVDWKVGEEIVVAPTGLNFREFERRFITAIDSAKTTLTINQPFLFKHAAFSEALGNNDTLNIRAEVGLVTRNILVTGGRDSSADQYGAHILLHGNAEQGLEARIENIEVSECGQPKIIGRHCIYFQMNGDMKDSGYVKSNSVHDSYSHMLVLQAVQGLTVSNNLLFNAKGHGLYLQEGSEINHNITNNLVMGIFQSWYTLDSCSAFWITNPMNVFQFNRAAGSEYMGIVFNFQDALSGLSAAMVEVCPSGSALGGSLSNNLAHSSTYGFFMNKLISRTLPCAAFKNVNATNPWEANPAVKSTVSNFTIYKCQVNFQAKSMGLATFTNFTMADYGAVGFNVEELGFSKDMTTLENSVFVAQSANNGQTSYSTAVVTPSTNGFKVSDARFYRFPTESNVFRSCGDCTPQGSISKATFFEKIKYNSVNGSYVSWSSSRRDIFYDLDGSLSGNYFNSGSPSSNFSTATLIPFWDFNNIPGVCFQSPSGNRWDNSLLCNKFVTVRAVSLSNYNPQYDNSLLVSRVDPFPNTLQSSVSTVLRHAHYGLPYVCGYTYRIEQEYMLNFKHVTATPSIYLDDSDAAIILRFAYTESREVYDINTNVLGLATPFKPAQATLLNATSCLVADNYQNHSEKYVDVCISGKDKPDRTTVEIEGIICRNFCPKPIDPNDGGGWSDGGDSNGGGGGGGGGNATNTTNQTTFVKEDFIRVWSNTTQWPQGVLPSPGDNVTIPGEWTILMDMDPAFMNVFQVQGDVIVDDRDTVVMANYIWIRAGSFRAGNTTHPFGYKLDIYINGSKTDPTYVIDKNIANNKVLVVTGRFGLFGSAPATTTTKLTSKAAVGDTFILVESADGWNVGDQLAISPSFSNPLEFEKVTITAISGLNISFSPALTYTHYGAATPTVSNAVGSLDMRTSIGHLTRKIRILRGGDDTWGFRVLVYGFNDGPVARTGRVFFVGVEFVGGGQADIGYAALDFKETRNNIRQSVIDSCSFTVCDSFCIRLLNNLNVTINNTVLYNGRKYIVWVENQKNFNFSSNLMIGAVQRGSVTANSSTEDVACYTMWKPVDFNNDLNVVENNLCHGSQGQGFVLPFTPCEYTDNQTRFTDNVASSARVGFILTNPQGGCALGRRLKAFASGVGLVAYPTNSLVKYSEFMFADNNRSLSLRQAFTILDDNNVTLNNSWFSALSRPTCDYCYGPTATHCNGTEGLRLLVTTGQAGVSYPTSYGPGIDGVSRQAAFDSKAFITNVLFENFKQSYVTQPSCGNNVVFKPNPGAIEYTGSHHLFNTSCTECEPTSFGQFAPSSSMCGNMSCTGFSNYLVQDHTGEFLGFPGTIIPNNTWIGDGEANCTAYPTMTAHICTRRDFAVVEYESIAKDYNSRVVWPVDAFYDGGNWTSTTNAFAQWEGNQLQGRRLARFVTTLVVNRTYNFTFGAQPPSDMRFQLQKRNPVNGTSGDWAAIYIYYPVANYIAVAANKVIVKPILSSSTDQVQNYTSDCGANKYFYKNGTIAFILTDSNCQIKVSLTSNVQVSARLQTTVTEFFSNGGVTKFVDRMCAYLNISTDRLKVVGVYSGSAVVDFYVIPTLNVTADANAPVADTSNSTTEQQTQLTELSAISQMLLSAPSSNVDLGGLGPLISSSTTVNIINTDGTAYVPPEVVTPDSTANTALIIGLAVAGVVLAVLIGVGIYFLVRRLRQNKMNQVQEIVEPVEKEDSTVIKAMEVIPNSSTLELGANPADQAPETFEKWESSFIMPTSSKRRSRFKSTRE